MSHQNRAFLQLLVAAALFSTGGAAIKATHLGSWEVAGFRSVAAGVVICALVPLSRRRRAWTARTLAVGLTYALTVVLFVHANKLTTAANAIFLQLTAPLYVALLSPRLLGEPFKRRHAVLGICLALGLVFVFVGGEQATAMATSPSLGNGLAVLSGLCYGLTILGLRFLTQAPEQTSQPAGGQAAAAIVCGNLLAFLICLPMMLPLGPVAAQDALVVLYLGVFQLGLGYVLVTRSIEKVPAVEASFLLLLEPVLNPVWAWLLHHEVPGVLALLGAGMILFGSLSNAFLQNRERAAVGPPWRKA